MIDKVVKSHRKGATAIEREKVAEAFQEDLAEVFDDLRITWRTRVTEVKWRNGVAFVYRENELPARLNAKGHVVRVLMKDPVLISCTQEEATSIEVGSWIDLTGTVRFTDSMSHYNVHLMKRDTTEWEQYLYAIQFPSARTTTTAYLTFRECEIFIDDTEYESATN